MANWSTFSERHRSATIQNFRLRNLSELLDRHFYSCANSWNYIGIGGVARTVQRWSKFAILYGKNRSCSAIGRVVVNYVTTQENRRLGISLSEGAKILPQGYRSISRQLIFQW